MYRNKKHRKQIAEILDYTFKDEQLLLRALTRRSGLNEGRQQPQIGDYQRLEFIGDKVLNLVVSEILMENHPDWNEGQLTKKVSEYVNNKGPLATMAKKLGWGEYLIVGAGEEHMRSNTKVLSDAFEALIGALWLDADKDYKFIRKFLLTQLKALGLSDFNEDYAQAVTKIGMQAAVSDVFEMALPELFEGGSGRGMDMYEWLRFTLKKKQATKPLTGPAAAFEKFIFSTDEEERSEADTEFLSDYEDDEVPAEIKIESKETKQTPKQNKSGLPVFSQSTSGSSFGSSYPHTSSTLFGRGITQQAEKETLLSPSLSTQTTLQDALVDACEKGDAKETYRLLKQGAKADVANTTGKQPIGAAVWGMNPSVVNALLQALGGVSPKSWIEYEQHNKKHYKEIFRVENFAPRRYSEYQTLLQKMDSSPFVRSYHLELMKDSHLQTWEQLRQWVGKKIAKLDQILPFLVRDDRQTMDGIFEKTMNEYRGYQEKIKQEIVAAAQCELRITQ